MKILALTYLPIRAKKKVYQKAVEHYHETMPFHDGSIRPTPSFHKELVGISSLCRKEQLVNRVDEGDILLYFTTSAPYKCEKYNSSDERHSRLTAILEVVRVYKDSEYDSPHQMADDYYQSHGMTSPNNCFAGEDIEPRQEGCGIIDSNWEYQNVVAGYDKRVKDCSTYVITRSIYKNVQTPIPLFKEDFERILNVKLKNNTPFQQGKLNELTNYQYRLLLDHVRKFGETIAE